MVLRFPFACLLLCLRLPSSWIRTLPSLSRGRASDEEIQALRRKGAVEPAPPTPGFFSRMFVVTKAMGGGRLEADHRPLNSEPGCGSDSFSDGDISDGSACCPQERLDGLHRSEGCVPSDPDPPCVSQVSQVHSRREDLAFRVLCFGLSTAPQVFTHVMAPVSGFLHQLGIRCLVGGRGLSLDQPTRVVGRGERPQGSLYLFGRSCCRSLLRQHDRGGVSEEARRDLVSGSERGSPAHSALGRGIEHRPDASVCSREEQCSGGRSVLPQPGSRLGVDAPSGCVQLALPALAGDN